MTHVDDSTPRPDWLTGKYGRAPDWLYAAMREGRITPMQAHLWIRLARYADETGRAWPSRARLAAELGVAEPSVSRMLRALEAAKLVRVEPRSMGRLSVYALPREVTGGKPHWPGEVSGGLPHCDAEVTRQPAEVTGGKPHWPGEVSGGLPHCDAEVTRQPAEVTRQPARGNPPGLPDQTKDQTIGSDHRGERSSDAPASDPAAEIETLESRYRDRELVRQAREGCGLTRRSGRMADSVWVTTLRRLDRHPADAVERSMRIFVDRHADGAKDERYLVGIAREEARRGQRPRRGLQAPAPPDDFSAWFPEETGGGDAAH